MLRSFDVGKLLEKVVTYPDVHVAESGLRAWEDVYDIVLRHNEAKTHRTVSVSGKDTVTYRRDPQAFLTSKVKEIDAAVDEMRHEALGYFKDTD